MNPENTKIRNRTIFQVVGLFLICVTIGILLLKGNVNFSYTSGKITEKELSECQSKLEFMNNRLWPELAAKSLALDSLKALYPVDRGKADKLYGEIRSSLTTLLTEQKQKLGAAEQAHLDKIIGTFFSLLAALEETSKMQKENADCSTVRTDLLNAQNQITQLKEELKAKEDAEKSGGGGGGGGDDKKPVRDKECKQCWKLYDKLTAEHAALQSKYDKLKSSK